MEIQIQFLRQPNVTRQTLRARGWLLSGEPDAVRAEHPDVDDESSAREALCRLGLLTSRNVRIRFGPGQPCLY